MHNPHHRISCVVLFNLIGDEFFQKKWQDQKNMMHIHCSRLWRQIGGSLLRLLRRRHIFSNWDTPHTGTTTVCFRRGIKGFGQPPATAMSVTRGFTYGASIFLTGSPGRSPAGFLPRDKPLIAATSPLLQS